MTECDQLEKDCRLVATAILPVGEWGIEEGFLCTEAKAKVVAAVWGTELIQFLAVLAILLQDDLNNRMNSGMI